MHNNNSLHFYCKKLRIHVVSQHKFAVSNTKRKKKRGLVRSYNQKRKDKQPFLATQNWCQMTNITYNIFFYETKELWCEKKITIMGLSATYGAINFWSWRYAAPKEAKSKPPFSLLSSNFYLLLPFIWLVHIQTPCLNCITPKPHLPKNSHKQVSIAQKPQNIDTKPPQQLQGLQSSNQPTCNNWTIFFFCFFLVNPNIVRTKVKA